METKKLVKTAEEINHILGNAVLKEEGKGLYPDADKSKLEGISAGANKNVQADWDEVDEESDAYIKNKPTIPSSIVVDAELSLESENAVQNKVITEALGGKQDSIADLDTIRQGAEKGATAVQEVEGYGLSQEDFTTTLKNKLSGLENYDDAEVQAAIEALGARLDALVGTSASEAIDTFNEIVAFLDGVEDTATLEGIIADIGKQISAVEAKIPTDYVKPSELANVATSGSYADLKDKPTIPDAVTEQTVSGWGFTKNEGTVTSIVINGEEKIPDASGLVDLGEIEGGGGAMPLNIISGLPYDATVAPNTAVLSSAWMGYFNVYLTAPTDTSIMNTYVVALADLGGGSLTFNKDIKWVNDEAPVLEANSTLLEMCITYYHGNYVGVWGRSRGRYDDL